MSQSAPLSPAHPLRAPGPRGSLVGAIVEASKPRITRLVTITSGVGFAMAALTRRWEMADLAITASAALAGTALSASGANALNQWMERDRDALMPRTCDRPLPQGRLAPPMALSAGTILAAAGVLLLWVLCGPIPALVSLATVLIYLFLYTPLKPVTPLATLIGAVPGALPPLIGWTAAAGTGASSLLDAGAIILFSIMFIWQIPHFLAIAWMYRDDYAAGGYRVLPVVDRDGRRTARSILGWSIAMVPATVAPVVLMQGPAAIAFGVIAGAMGLAFLALTVKVVRTRERADARRAFIASVIHLPLVLVFMVACAVLSKIL